MFRKICFLWWLSQSVRMYRTETEAERVDQINRRTGLAGTRYRIVWWVGVIMLYSSCWLRLTGALSQRTYTTANTPMQNTSFLAWMKTTRFYASYIFRTPIIKHRWHFRLRTTEGWKIIGMNLHLLKLWAFGTTSFNIKQCLKWYFTKAINTGMVNNDNDRYGAPNQKQKE